MITVRVKAAVHDAEHAGRIVRHWDPDRHPRDKHGRFVETGGTVRLASGLVGRVIGHTGGRVQVRAGGRIVSAAPHSVEVVPPGTPSSPRTEAARAAPVRAAREAGGAPRDRTALTSTRARDLKEGDRAMLPHPETGDLTPATIVTHDDNGSIVEMDARRADGSVDTLAYDRYAMIDRIDDAGVGPEEFPDEVAPEDDGPKPPPVIPKPAPPKTLIARPALYTYQRQRIVALGLDADKSNPPDVRQAAARVRLRMPLTASQSTALADALRARAAADGVRPVEARSLERAAHRFDAAAAEIHGSAPPEFDGGRTAAVATDARDLTEGDTVALANRSGGIDVVTVRGIKTSMGGRVVVADLEHQDGTRETRTLTGRSKGWLLPDPPADEPVPPPGDRREHIGTDRLRAGDSIDLGDAGQPGQTGTVTSIKPGGPLGTEVMYTAGHQLYQTSMQSRDGGPVVVRTARGPASQDQPWDMVMPPEHPEQVDRDQLQPGDRVRLSLGGRDGRHVTGVIHDIDQHSGEVENGHEHYLVTLRQDDGDQTSLYVPHGDPVTRLVRADDNAEARIAEARAERQLTLRAQSIRSAIDQVVNDQRTSDLMTIDGVIHHPSIVTVTNALKHNALRPYQLQSAIERVRALVAPEIRRSGGDDARKLAEQRLMPVLEEIARRDHDNFVRSLVNATDGIDPTAPDARRQISEARQRVVAQWKDSPPPVAADLMSRALATVGEAMLAARGDASKTGDRPDVPVLPEGTDLAARVDAYRKALPDPGDIGKSTVTRAMFDQPVMADLEAGRAPAVRPTQVGIPDKAEDGGPGHTAMRHLDIVMAAGKDLDTELQQRISKTLNLTPERLARSEAAETRINEIAREGITLRREKHDAAETAGMARAKELGYPNMYALSFKATRLRPDPGDVANYADAKQAAEAAGKPFTDKLETLAAERRQLEATDLISKKTEADARRQAALDVLQQVRPDGLGGVNLTYRSATGKQQVMAERGEAVKAMRWAEKSYPASWLSKARDRGQRYASGTSPDGTDPNPAYRLGTVQRGHYQDSKREIRLSKGTERVTGAGEYGGVAVHELGHAMEQAVPGLLALEHSYLWSRTSSGDVGSRAREKKKMIYPGEHGYRDDFPEHYTGKDYGTPDQSLEGSHVAFELLTTAAESLFAGSPYLDDGLRQWLLGVLATI